MSSFLDRLESGNVQFEKCGDVVVSPSDNMVAMFCHFCRDLFSQLPEFLRHLQSAHGDVLQFTLEQNVYSVEELMSPSDAEEESKHSCGDSGFPLELVKGIGNEDSKEDTPSINILAEVETILFASEDCQEYQEELCEPIFELATKRKAKPEQGKKPLSICDLKSHSIARQSRKRMTHVKKRILRNLASDASIPVQVPFANLTNLNFAVKREQKFKPANLQLENAADHPEADFLSPLKLNPKTPIKPPINSVDFSIRKSTLTKASKVTSKSNSNLSSILEHIPLKTSNSSQEFRVLNDKKESVIKEIELEVKRRSSPIDIQKVDILPRLNIKIEKSNNNSIELTETRKPKRRSSSTGLSPVPMTTIVTRSSGENSSSKCLELQQNQLENQDKTQDSKKVLSTKNQQIKKKSTAAKDLKTFKPAENLPTKKAKAPNVPEQIEMRMDKCTLLKCVGLPIICNPNYEDKIMLEDLEELRQRAAKFCALYKKYDSIWNSRKMQPEEVPTEIAQFAKEVNRELGCNLTANEIKCILNLISSWFSQQIDRKCFNKAELSPSADHYLKLFAFIPLYNRFVYFCETCVGIFTFEGHYKKHLITHQFVFKCPHCGKCFKRLGFYDKHLQSVHPSSQSA